MMAIVRMLLLGVALVVSAGSMTSAQRRRPEPPPAPVPPPPDIRARALLSQTAAWVGDPLDYTVEIETAPGVELVAEDLLPEKLGVEGLELGQTTTSLETRADGWLIHRHVYRVVPWDTTPPHAVAPLTLRFRRPVTAASADGTAPATTIEVPGVSLAVRSTLPDEGVPDGARDRLTRPAPPLWLAWLRPTGFGFIALGIAPVVLWMATRLQRPRVSRPRPSARSLQTRLTAMFDDLQIIDTSTDDGRRRAYDRIESDLRGYLAQAEGVPAAALTSAELRTRLASSSRVQADVLCDVLADCEQARYAPPDRLPSAEQLGDTMIRLRTALGR